MHTSRIRPKHQRGASLIELMTGMTVGLLVVLAAVGTLMFTSLSATAVNDNIRLQQKSEVFFRLIRFQIEQAGAMSIASPSGNYEIEFSQAYAGLPSALTGLTSTALVSVHGVDGAGNMADTLRVSHQHEGDDDRDCLGIKPPPSDVNKIILNEYTVNAAQEILCVGGNNGGGAQAIIDGVEDFQVMYGIKTYPADTPLDPATYTFQFFSANQVTDWDKVSAISICLQLRSDVTNHPIVGTLPIGCSGTAIPNDGRLHRAYTRTYSLRNALF